MAKRWLLLGLITVLVATAVTSGWLFFRYQPTPPPPPASQARGLIPVQTFQVTMTIPPPPPPPGDKTVVRGLIQAPPTTLRPGPEVTAAVEAPPLKAEEAVAPKPTPALAPEAVPGEVLPLKALTRTIKVQGLEIPPPDVVPPFAYKEKPIVVLETERKGRVVTVRGTTNLAVEGNGVQVSLFRVFREAGADKDRRAGMAARDLSLWFEGRFPVEDGPWFKTWAERTEAYPGVFRRIASVDRERIYIEVLFTAKKADVGGVPGLSVYPIPGTDKQVYRIVRPILLSLDKEAEAIVAQASGLAPSPPPAVSPPPEPAPAPEAALPPPEPKPTKIIIRPLKWLNGPRPQKT